MSLEPSQPAGPIAKTSREIPVESLTLPGVGGIRPAGLLVIVGPNSSGKTQLLRDVHFRVIGQPRELVVCDGISINKPRSFDTFVQHLIEDGAVRKTETSGTTRLESTSPQLGIGSGTGDVGLEEARSMYNAFIGGLAGKLPPVGDQRFLTHFGPMLTTALFLENRLAATNPASTFDYLSQKAGNDLQALYLNSVARDKFKTEVLAVFSKAVGIDPTRHGVLAIRVSDLPEPSPIDWISPDKVSKLRGIEQEGDGLRSYCAVCIALLLGKRPICLIDEPEICLHPPQAHALGRFIGSFGTQTSNATLVATHSSQILRGILETGDNLRILRLVRVGGRFVARIVEEDLLRASLRRPAARSEIILEGIFADAVAIVEADTDRVVYQAALEIAGRAVRRDVYFAPVGGIGAMADTAHLYRTLRMPVAVIADLDAIRDPRGLRRIAEELSTENVASGLEEACTELLQRLRRVPPHLAEHEVVSKLGVLAGKRLGWSNNDDEVLVRELRALANDIDRMRRVKNGGVKAFAAFPELMDRMVELIERCAKIGSFLVPVGDLEYWAPDLMKESVSKEKKAEWANEFVKRIG